MGWRLRFRVSNKFPGEADPAGLGTTFAVGAKVWGSYITPPVLYKVPGLIPIIT